MYNFLLHPAGALQKICHTHQYFQWPDVPNFLAKQKKKK